MLSKTDLIDRTEAYFNEKIEYRELSLTTQSYKEFFEGIIDLNREETSNREDLYFSNGKAIGPLWAAMCLDDIMRTRCFIKGIKEAISDLLKEKEKIRICYAGTGPYATLLIANIVRFPSDRVSYHFIEINDSSINAVKQIIDHPIFSNYDITIEKADLTTYKFQNALPDLIISETLQSLLDKEQQVSIHINLMKQCDDRTVFIPENISINLALENTDENGVASYDRLQKLFEISNNTYKDFIGKTELYEIDQHIIDPLISKDTWFCLLTDITVYKDNILHANDSGLTVARASLFNIKEEGRMHVKSHYQISDQPQLHISVN